jgi:hypothetical protein
MLKMDEHCPFPKRDNPPSVYGNGTLHVPILGGFFVSLPKVDF